jgi:hypothetical protein
MLEALARPVRRNIVPQPLSGHRHLPVASADSPECLKEAHHPFGGHGHVASSNGCIDHVLVTNLIRHFG